MAIFVAAIALDRAAKPSILPAFSHARAPQPSQLSLISLAFLSREEIWAARVSLC
jgi:hypothetical protein